MKKVFLKSMLLLCALIVGSGSVWADTTVYSWNGNGSTTTASETGGTAEAKGGNSNIVVGAQQKGNYCLKMNKGFSNTNYIEISLDENLKTGDIVTIGAFRTSSTAAVLGVDFGTTATQTLKDDTDVLESNGTPTDFEITVPAGANGSNKIRLYRNSGSTGMWVSKVVVTTASSGTGETATWSLSPTTATVTAGQSTTMQLTTNYDGTLNFSSNATSIATVSYNTSTKVITVTGQAAGSTTISVTGEATATYNAISKVISVTVNHAELESNVTDVMSGFGYSYFGLTAKGTGSDDYAQPEVTSTDKTDNYGVTISIAKAEGGTLPRYDATYVRFYKGNTITVTAPSGSYITKIVFTEPASGASWSGSMSVEDGDYVNTDKTWYATSTGVTSIVLTGITNTNRIGGMEVYLMVADKSITPSSETGKHYATFVAPYKVKLDAGVIAYIGTYNNSSSSLVLHNFEGSATGTVLPANTPVVLKATSSDAISAAVSTADANDVEDGETTNNLHGMYVATTAPANAYVLGYNSAASQETGFYQFSGTIPANRAYLIISGGAAQAAGIRIVESESQATNVEQIEASDKAVKFIENGRILILRDGNTYDALGRRIH